MMRVFTKMPNWKAPGSDNIQSYWAKNLTPTRQISDVFAGLSRLSGVVPDWLTKGRTVLIQKDKTRGNIASNYRPTTCLPLVWKLLTGVLADEIYDYLEKQNVIARGTEGV